ncbi:hypothetical protein LTR36_007424 [Oleoguttula mirabilis]|uniref:Uncharacterized protein n=1 Tax=Oleoguttula mirabilis TaxID=1507867 RepID=A0AAV9JA49_9PEZI|nr:hypothetical protein LTR36_007424 [Oleoguttula mirabilis]
MAASAPNSFLSPTTYFSIACVAFSVLAASTVWRNQQASSSEGKATRSQQRVVSRPQPRRRVAVDSLYAEPDDALYATGQSQLPKEVSTPTPTAVLSKLVQTSAAVAHQLRSSHHLTASRITTTSLLGELSLLTTSLCRLQQLAVDHAALLSLEREKSTCFEATTSSLSDILALICTELDSPHGSSALVQEALQQLRDQRPALEFLLENHASTSLPLTPPPETTTTASLEAGGMMPPFIPATGLTPSVDAKCWIEPPPEYSPPSHGTMEAALVEKADSKDRSPPAPEEQPSTEQEVYDTDALYNAVTSNNADLVGDLLEHGADASAAIGELQRTALHQAAHLNHISCLTLLLRSGAVMSAEDAKGDTPLHLAAWAGHVEGLSTLLAHGADVDWLSGRDGYSALWCAISAYHIDAARLLLRSGARVSLRSAAGGGLLPLHQAAVTGQSAMCELLLERGAQVDTVDDDKNTPLHYAATCGSTASVKVLLLHGASVTATQNQGLTPAHWAAHKGHTEVLSTFLAYGAPVNAAAEEGASLLHLAANRGHTAAVRLLLESGAAHKARATWYGTDGTAAQMARASGHVRVAQLIESFAK